MSPEAEPNPNSTSPTTYSANSVSATSISIARASTSGPPQEPEPEPKPKSKSEPEQKHLINLLRGWPAPSLLPTALLRAAADHVLADPAVAVPALQYAPDPGYQPLRESLAAWLGRCYGKGVGGGGGGGGGADGGRDGCLRRGDFGTDMEGAGRRPWMGAEIKVTAEEIAITGGASQGLACVLQSFTDPGYTRAVWAVAPCYFLACPIFEDAGFAGRLRAVPEVESVRGGGGGVDLEKLEEGMRTVDEGAEKEEKEEREKEVKGRKLYKDPGPHRKLYRHVIYLVATSANPSGKTMSLSHREALVRLARKYDALIISDDVYDFLQWPVTSSSSSSSSSPASSSSLPQDHGPSDPILLPTLSQIDLLLPHDNETPKTATTTKNKKNFGNAISNASFSKLAGPGTRTGWIHGAPDFVHGFSQTGSNRSGGAASQLVAAAAHRLVVSGELERWLGRVVRPGLRRRHGLMLRAVREELAGVGAGVEGGEGSGVFGGYFVWLRLPDGMDADEVAARARAEEELIVAPGRLFEVKGDEGSARFPGHLRLCFSWEEEENLVEGVRRLGRLLRRMLDGVGGKGEGREGEATQLEQELQMAC
ncbi:hypothetical protein VTK26DRAFT_3761 [Humicola hyalothermophila]